VSARTSALGAADSRIGTKLEPTRLLRG
jgi:hypothetical protein